MSKQKNTKNLFAVVPDGQLRPAALFAALDEAIEWALEKFGADQFSIRAFMSGDRRPAGVAEPIGEVHPLRGEPVN